MKLSSILGLNARAQIYSIPNNSKKGKKIAGSKILTKRVLRQAKIPSPLMYVKFRTIEKVYSYDWSKLPSSFALKPSRGLGGDGIIVVKKKSIDGKSWITTARRKVTIDDLKLHATDIIEGAYSIHNVPDVAFVEEYVGRHKTLRKFAYRGTPDVRIIVFNKVPVMAMLRLPTRESGGRANLHQGAIGVGIDIATGITTHAVWHGDPISFKPDTKRKLHGIKVPQWDTILETAVRAQEASHLGYLGVDLVLHPEKGPMILELNSEPGLEIQLANMSGLRRRLDRIEELKVTGPQHGIKLAKALFASSFAARVKAEGEGLKTIRIWEMIKIVSVQKKRVELKAKVDTGAWRTSIDRNLAKSLGLLTKENILWAKTYKSVLGAERRPVINITFYLGGRKIRTIASVADRSNLRSQLIIGRRDLAGFIVQPRKIKNAN
jgi:alpha-L-glutamate ligase-like protein